MLINHLRFLTLTYLLIAGCSNHERSPEGSNKNIFGRDDRIEIDSSLYPFSAIGRLDSGCTGTLIGENLILTAAHCLIKNGEGTVKPTVTYFRSGYRSSSPNNKAWIEEFWYGSNSPETERSKDWAIVRLKGTLAPSSAFMNITSKKIESSLPSFADMAGYSADRRGGDILTAVRFCSIRTSDNEGRLLHDCDASSGISGAPLFVYNPSTLKAEIVALSVSEFRNGAPQSVFTNRYTEELANVAISSSGFYAVSELLTSYYSSAHAGSLSIDGVLHKVNTNTEPSASPAANPSPQIPKPDATTDDHSTSCAAAVRTSAPQLIEMTNIIWNEAMHLIDLTTLTHDEVLGLAAQTLYDEALRLRTLVQDSQNYDNKSISLQAHSHRDEIVVTAKKIEAYINLYLNSDTSFKALLPPLMHAVSNVEYLIQ